MAIVRWDPFKDFLALQNRLNKLFEETFGWGGTPSLREGGWVPLIDMYETDKEIKVKAEVPGIDPKDISISVDEDTLVIEGERKFSEEVKEEDYYRLERRYGAFHRTIPLPTEVEKDKIEATYEDGVLDITLPKVAKAKPKRVKVKVKAKK